MRRNARFIYQGALNTITECKNQLEVICFPLVHSLKQLVDDLLRHSVKWKGAGSTYIACGHYFHILTAHALEIEERWGAIGRSALYCWAAQAQEAKIMEVGTYIGRHSLNGMSKNKQTRRNTLTVGQNQAATESS